MSTRLALGWTPLGPQASPRDFTGTAYQQGIYSAETTQRHVPGRAFLEWDGRVFKYAKASATLNTDLLAQQVTAQHMAYATVAASTAVGATELTVDFGATDGAAAGGVIAVDELAGGYAIIFPHSENSMNRGIRGNTAADGGGDEITLYLDAPLNVATVVDVTHAEAICSPYYNIKASTTGDTARGFVGLPMVPATVGQYCWVQTWGPCWIAPQTDVGTGASNQQVVARYDGSIQAHDYTDTTYSDKQQHIGFVLSHATAGTQGAPFIMLQISR